MSNWIACDVLTGFLGSGKSTLLNAFLRTEAGPHTAVVVNEFGTIGIDQFMFEELADGVYLMDSGCICCTVTNSLSETLLELWNTAQRRGAALERVVIETSGMADPLPILHALIGDRTINSAFRLGQVIATVDGLQGLKQIRMHAEPGRQLAVAEQIVVTKTECVDSDCLHSLRDALRSMNETASLHLSTAIAPAVSVFRESSFEGVRLPGLFRRTGDWSGAHGARHRSRVGSWSAYIESPVTWVGVAAWWSLLMQRFGKDLLRCKGLIHLESGEVIRLQGVGTHFHSPEILSHWPDPDDPRARVVCIGSSLDEAWLAASLRALSLKDPASRPLYLEDLDYCQ